MKRDIKVHIALFLVSLIYGATFTIAKEVMPLYIKPFGFIVIRVMVATICLFIFHSIYIKGKISDRKDFIPLAISAAFGVAANMLFFFKGLSITTPINASVLMLNTPIFVLIFASFFLKEKLSLRKISGIIVAATGALLLIGGVQFKFDPETAWGDVYVACNAIIFAFYLVYSKKLMVKYHPMTVTLYSFFFGFFFVLPFGFNQVLEVDFVNLPFKIWLYIAFVTIGATFVTYLLNAFALQRASSSMVGSYIYFQPVLASLIAIISGRDIISLEKLTYISIVFVGVFLANFTNKSKKVKNLI